MRRALPALLVVVCLWLVGCGSPAPVPDGGASDGGTPDAGSPDGGSRAPDAGVWDGGTLELNDVSVLFPLPGDAGATGLLSASSTGARGVLFPSALYDTVGHVSGSTGTPPPGGIGEAAYSDLRVVAVRVDPCFASLTPDPHGVGCENQLRVIFQEVQGSPPGAFDSALHVFYRLTRAEAYAFARSVALLRQAAAPGQHLGALAVHPLMVSQGLSGSMATGVEALILAYAGQQNLIRVTRLSATQVAFAWTFDGFDVPATGAPTPMVIPTLPLSAVRQELFSGFSTASVQGRFMPATTDPDDLTVVADTVNAGQLSPSARAAGFAAVVHVDHPARHSPNTIDCASCHFATPVSRIVGPMFSFVEAQHPDVFTADGTFVQQAELTPTFNAAVGFDVHAFSYFAQTPAINQRTVNESAAIVDYLNRNAP